MAEKNKDKISLPFSNFYINVYLLPGSLFLFASIIFMSVFPDKLPNFNSDNSEVGHNSLFELIINDSFWKNFGENTPFVLEIVLFLIVLSAVMIFGLVISSIAGFFLDNLWMQKTIRRPFERILDLESKRFIRQSTYLTLFFATNLYTITVILTNIEKAIYGYLILFIVYLFKDWLIVSPIHKITGLSNKREVYALKKVVKKRAVIFQLLLNRRDVVHRFHKSNKKSLFTRFYGIIAWLLYIYVGIWIDITNYLFDFIGRSIGIEKALPTCDIKKFKDKYLNTFDYNDFKDNTQIYWNTYIFISNNSPVDTRVTNVFLKHSVGLRNLTVAAFLSLLVLLFLKTNNDKSTMWLYWSFTWYICSIFLFIAYNRIHYLYFTKYLFRAFIVHKPKEETN